jgi:hypothetical protein
MDTEFVKERNPNYVIRGWKNDDGLWRGSFNLNGNWYFDDFGQQSRGLLERSLVSLAYGRQR